MSVINNPLKILLAELRLILTDRATGQYGNLSSVMQSKYDTNYKQCREELIKRNIIMPDFMIDCPNLKLFWIMIKSKYKQYEERKEFINKEVNILLNQIKDM